jgi:hypothetical protein
MLEASMSAGTRSWRGSRWARGPRSAAALATLVATIGGVIESLRPWIGKYESSGWCEGLCPTGVPTRFTETFEFRFGDSWMHYDEHAIGADGKTLHTESGVLRAAGGGVFEVSLVMNSGRVELGTASVDGNVLRTDATTFHNDHLGVRATAREFVLTENGCEKHLWLANAAWTELTHHMWGAHTRTDASGT